MYMLILHKKCFILRRPENHKLCEFKVEYMSVVAIKQHKTSDRR